MRDDVEAEARNLEAMATGKGQEEAASLLRAAQLLRELDATPPGILPLDWRKSPDETVWRAHSLGLSYQVADGDLAELKKDQCQCDYEVRVRAALDDRRDLVAGFAVPHGWMLVPEGPTPEMQLAGFDALGRDRECDCDQYDCYMAMVAVAPKPFAGSIPYDSPFSFERTSHLRDIKELQDALRPFAKAATTISSEIERGRLDDRLTDVVGQNEITVRDVRRAADILRSHRAVAEM